MSAEAVIGSLDDQIAEVAWSCQLAAMPASSSDTVAQLSSRVAACMTEDGRALLDVADARRYTLRLRFPRQPQCTAAQSCGR
jgi:hypothetical protein